jgi:diguanylate cyclase (GGDEF)-like protein
LPSTSIEGAVDSAERVRAAVEKHVLIASGMKLSVTLSAGVSTYRSGEQQGPEWLLKEADMALYEAKRSGRNAVHQFAALEPPSAWSLTA